MIDTKKGFFIFKYDPNKSEINQEKHGIDFKEAQQL